MSVIDRYSTYLLPRYSNYPCGRYVSLLLVRKVESEAIFRTEGSGEPLNREFVFAGRRDGERQGEQIIPRIVISKRKQTAVERRTGRELLRRYELLGATKTGHCTLNTNTPCERCIDCMIYGYAAGGGGAQKSRVITDDAFSLHSADLVVGERQFNALFDNSTMRNPENRAASTSIGTDEYVRPETTFIDIETLKDVTPDELRYVLGNILRSARYGAISSRIGKLDNIIAGVIFSDCELFSNLELTQNGLRSARQRQRATLSRCMSARSCRPFARAADELRGEVAGQYVALSADEIGDLRREIVELYSNEEALVSMLRRQTESYGSQA
ncbi:MAG: hypothetical protein KatS3mg057_2572 [Herpetosiphonaceae bacterium]|nr:MAG: hypothetical protein KatS3mg057_2572 [Herpetosiphonaceae bacterium]